MPDDTLTFHPLENETGLEIVDRIERRRIRLFTPQAVSPEPAAADGFYFPVARAVSLTTSRITIPRSVVVVIRDESGGVVGTVKSNDSITLPAGHYTVDLSLQIKSYLDVEGALTVTSEADQTRIDFGDAVTIRCGARSHHERPAETITTTEDPHDMMTAIGALGAALKTTTVERSYPTLRGHPPEIRLGDEFELPAAVEPPDTGIQFELPLDLAHIYVAAPLAYYLGADVTPGSTPQLTTASGFAYPLSTDDAFEATVERVLKQVFLFDTITRTEGYYPVRLHERDVVEPRVDLDFESLYDAPPGERLAAYLDIPFEAVADQVPQWPLTTFVEPRPATAEQLPYVLNGLGLVKTSDTQPVASSNPHPVSNSSRAESPEFVRLDAQAASDEGQSFVDVSNSRSVEQGWVGPGVPIGASKLTTEGFRNRLARDSSEGPISLTIVANDDRMDAERDIVEAVYGDREHLPMAVETHRNLTVEQLETVLTHETDFFHYIGHTDADGITCTDGTFDLQELDETGVETFLLNSCQSYRQGSALLDAGAIGGVVTLNPISNEGAATIGQTLARLLNAGFPFGPALTLARDQSAFGGQYIVVGDSTATVTQPATLTPTSIAVDRSDGKYELQIRPYATINAGLGSLFAPTLADIDSYYLTSHTVGLDSVTEDQLEALLDLEDVPVTIDGDLYWSGTDDIVDRV